jgi:orotidine-5'-phosphate decarboxylase
LQYGQSVVEACVGATAAVKFQVAFFERHGARGIVALERCLAQAKGAGLLTIMDAKRGDIGSTMQGYADAYLDPASALAGDAVTLSPYLGYESLRPALDTAKQHGKGVFVLCLTSNPEGASVQHARGADGMAVANAIASAAAADNAGVEPWGDVGLVIGATVGSAVAELPVDVANLNGPILAPGVGAQGGSYEDVRAVFGEARGAVLAHQGRALMGAGPFVEKLRDAIRHAAAESRQIRAA